MLSKAKLAPIVSRLYSPRWLVWTNAGAGVLSITAGDAIQQRLERFTQQTTSSEHDWRRTAYMSLAGVYFGLFGHYWYSLLDRRFPGNGRGQVVSKLLAETAMGPPLVSGAFFVVGKCRGYELDKCWNNLKDNFVVVCLTEWCVYLPLQYINFAFLPPHLRYAYVAVISLAYDTFLSFILHRSEIKARRKLQEL